MLRLKKSGLLNAHKMDSEQLIIFAYCIYVVVNVLTATQFKNLAGWDIIVTSVNYFSLLAVCYSFLLNNLVRKNTLLLYIVLAFLGVVVMLSSSRISATVLVVAFVAAGRSIKSDKILKRYFAAVLSTIIFTLILYALGIYAYDVMISGERTRLYLGFTYTTNLPNYFFHLLLVYFVIKKSEIGVRDTVLIVLFNWYIYKLTDTKAVYYEVLLLLLLMWGLRIVPAIYKGWVFRVGTLTAMPILAVLSIWLSFIYTPSNSILLFLNKILTTRLSLGHLALERYGLTWFGTKTEWVTGRYGIERMEEYFYVDSSYLNIALSFGVVTLVLVIIGFFILNRKALNEQRYVLCVALLMLAVHSFSDPQLFELRYDPFLLLVGTAIFRRGTLPINNMKMKAQVVSNRHQGGVSI